MSEYAAERETARRVESQRPGWMVVWGVYSMEYVAFPLFPDGSGVVLASGYASEIVLRMQEIEDQAERLWRVKKGNT